MLLERIELSTSPLPRECSTSELQQRCGRVIRLKRKAAQGCLDGFFRVLYRKIMADKKTPKSPAKSGSTREDRLKAALKANLARRKAQAKARAPQAGGSGQDKE